MYVFQYFLKDGFYQFNNILIHFLIGTTVKEINLFIKNWNRRLKYLLFLHSMIGFPVYPVGQEHCALCTLASQMALRPQVLLKRHSCWHCRLIHTSSFKQPWSERQPTAMRKQIMHIIDIKVSKEWKLIYWLLNAKGYYGALALSIIDLNFLTVYESICTGH